MQTKDFIKTTLADLDGGNFVNKLSEAMSQVALGVKANDKQGKVTLEFTMKRIPNSAQINMSHKLKFDKPTLRGKTIEEDTTSTPLYVGVDGKLTLMPDTQLDIPGLKPIGKEHA